MMKNVLPWSLFGVAVALILVVSGLLLSKPPIKIGRYQVAIIKGSQPDIADTPVKIDTENGQSWFFDGDKWQEIATSDEKAEQTAAAEHRARLQLEIEALNTKQAAEIAAMKARLDPRTKSLAVTKTAPSQVAQVEVRKVYKRRVATLKRNAAVKVEKEEAPSEEEAPPDWLSE